MIDGRHARHAPAGSSPWVGDMKVRVEKGCQVWRTYSKPLMLEARGSFERGEARRVRLRLPSALRQASASLVLEDPDGNRVEVFSGITAEKPRYGPLIKRGSSGRYRKPGYSYEAPQVQVETDGIGTLPVSVLNAMRREAILKLSAIRRKSKTRERVEPRARLPLLAPGPKRRKAEPALTAFFCTKPRLPASYDN